MASKTRTRPKTAPRRPPPRRPTSQLPILPIAVGVIFALIFVAIIVAYRYTSSNSTPSGEPVANVNCDSSEQLATHYHVHLDLIYKGQPVKVPANTGVQPTCLYWMHTHDDSGILHIEAPKKEASRQFTLGEFFKVWGQPLSSKQVATLSVGAGEQMKVWVNGQPYSGDPSKIVLKSHEQIVIDIGPAFVESPPDFTWDNQQYGQ